MRRHIFICLLFFAPAARSQTFTSSHASFNLGLHLAAGTHFRRIGFSFTAARRGRSVQWNPGIRLYYNLRNIGPQDRYVEMVTSLGIVYGFGRMDSSTNPFIDPLSNNLHKRNSAGYAFNYYWNGIHTSQATGLLSLQLGKIQLAGEDDVFAGGIRDEFRTGSFMVRYRDRNIQYGLNFFTGWTGRRGIPVTNSNYPSRNGYMDMSHTLYGKISAGLISAQLSYANHAGQIFQANAGLDNEHVRDIFQNKMVHRLFFSPGHDRWRGGADLPMIDTKGEPYLYHDGQQVRRGRPYVNIFLNPSLFY